MTPNNTDNQSIWYSFLYTIMTPNNTDNQSIWYSFLYTIERGRESHI